MKRQRVFSVALAVLVLAVAAFASITVTSSYVLSQGGTAIETNNTAVASYMEVGWQSNNVRLFYKYGAGGNTFTAGQYVADLVVSIDLTTGKYVTNKGGSGTLTSPQLTALKTTVKGWRNSAESFAISQGIVPGSAVAW